MVAAASLAGVLTACGGGSDSNSAEGSSAANGFADMDPVAITYAAGGPETAPQNQALVEWQEAVTERTDGKVTFENYWSASLLAPTDMLEGVGGGVATMGSFLSSYFPQELPVNTWAEGFGNAVVNSPIHDLVGGGAAMHEFQLTNQAAIDEFAAQNLKVIDVPSSPAYNMLCTRPIESPSDAAGVRARTSGPVWSATLAALGMVTVDVSFTEAYEALQRGVIDCMVNLPSAFTLLGLDEVAKEFVPLPFAQSYTVFAMNLDTWESLPGEVQEIMHEEAGTAAVAMWDKILDEEAGFGELLQSGEIRVNDASALVPTVDAQRGEALTDMVASAPEAVDDPQAVVDDYLERQEYWTQVLVDLGYEIRATDPDAVRGSFAELADVDLSDFQDRFAEEVIEATRPE